jgi:hypothetical protein
MSLTFFIQNHEAKSVLSKIFFLRNEDITIMRFVQDCNTGNQRYPSQVGLHFRLSLCNLDSKNAQPQGCRFDRHLV